MYHGQQSYAARGTHQRHFDFLNATGIDLLRVPRSGRIQVSRCSPYDYRLDRARIGYEDGKPDRAFTRRRRAP